MFSFFRKKQPAISGIEQFRNDFIIKIDDANNPITIQSVLGLNLQDYFALLGEMKSDGDYYNSNQIREYLISEKDYKARSKKFHEQISFVSEKLINEYNEKYDELFSVLVILKEYLDLHYQ